jgi:hypothetical protein
MIGRRLVVVLANGMGHRGQALLAPAVRGLAALAAPGTQRTEVARGPFASASASNETF